MSDTSREAETAAPEMIEVTPEMIEASVTELFWEMGPPLDATKSEVRRALTSAYLAMRSLRPKGVTTTKTSC
jgi:hypothetical protein